jgi:hypothetical protein
VTDGEVGTHALGLIGIERAEHVGWNEFVRMIVGHLSWRRPVSRLTNCPSKREQ